MRKQTSRRRSESRSLKSLTSRQARLEGLEDRSLLTNVSGAIAADTVWNLAGSPYVVTGDITIQPAATLTIDPGVQVQYQADTGITVNGRLLAEGTAFNRISFNRAAGVTGKWDGLEFLNTLTDSRLAYIDMAYGDGQGHAIGVDHARLKIDNATWTGTSGTILELLNPSLAVRNSQFPTSTGAEIIHGEYITGSEYLIIEGNTFANSNNGGDVIDILGADRPGPVMQILNNVFLGGGDDGLDLDGTDAHVEGNLFMNFHKNTSRATTSNAIATGLPQSGETNRTQVTIVRNIFVNNDHHILLKEDAFGTIENNVFINSTIAAIQFNEIGGTANEGPAVGGYLDGNIFQGNASLFKNLTKTATFQTTLTVNRSLLPNDLQTYSDGSTALAYSFGVGNISGNPQFVDAANGNYRLLPGSPAIDAGPNGIDMGAHVPGGPSLSGVPTGPSASNDQTITVAGPGITHYKYRLNGALYGPLTPVATPIQLTDLGNGDYTLDVIGMNDAGEWFQGQTPAFGEKQIELIAPQRVRNDELLPTIVRVRDSNGLVNALLTTPASFNNAAQLAATTVKIKRGIASQSPQVTAAADFTLELTGAAGTASKPIDVLDGTFPTQSYSGALSGNVVWDAATERRITANLTIPAGSKLTIQAGTRVLLGDKVNIIVNGELETQGTLVNPVVFNSISRALPWGGLAFTNALGTLRYTFLTNGGADTTRTYGHSNSQPLIMAIGSTVNCDDCFIINNVGKAFGSHSDTRFNLNRIVVSNVDTGGQVDESVFRLIDSMIKDLPNDDGVFADDDNDGIYLLNPHSSGEPSIIERSTILTTKDDCIDHTGAKLQIKSTWLEGCTHEGLASSLRDSPQVIDTVVTHTNQGFEAGYSDDTGAPGIGPNLVIRHSMAFDVDAKIDPGSGQQINAGFRFGDGYDWTYYGHLSARDSVVADSGDNIRNQDNSIPGPQPGAIDVTYTVTNDADFNADAGNLVGAPHFGPFGHLLRGSVGFNAAGDGLSMGRLSPPASAAFSIVQPGSLLRIDEVLARNVAAVNHGGTFPDLIELHNAGAASVSLAGMSITNDLAQPTKYVFAPGTTLGAGQRLVLYADSGAGAGEIHLGFSLADKGGVLRLYDSAGAGGALLDGVDYGLQLADRSVSRLNGGTWGLSQPSLGAANVGVETVAPSSVQKINEWLAVGNASFPTDFIELYNPALQPVDIGGLFLTNDPTNSPQLFQIAPLSFIDAKNWTTFLADGVTSAGGDHVNFTLGGTNGSIALRSATGALDQVTYGAQSAGTSQGRAPDGSAGITFMSPTPGAQNVGLVVPITAMFQENVSPSVNYTGAQDVWLDEARPTTALGADPRMDADGQTTAAGREEWSLLKWNLTGVPTSAVVSGATITLSVNNASPDLYQLYAVLRDWVESEATFDAYRAGQAWQTPGAAGAADHGAEVGVLNTGNTTGTKTITLNAAGVALVQSWVNNPATNFGVMIGDFDGTISTDGLEIRTSEYATTTSRPKLSITYTADTISPSVVSNAVQLNQAPESVSFTFSEDVQVDVGDIVIVNTTTSQTIPTGQLALNYNAATRTATWTFPGVGRLPNGDYTATLQTAGISDPAGNPLVGNGSESVSFFRLLGDANGDRAVTPADYAIWLANYQQSPGASSFNQGDFNLDGNVTGGDYTIWADNFGASLAPPPAPAAVPASSGSASAGSSSDDTSATSTMDASKPERNAAAGQESVRHAAAHRAWRSLIDRVMSAIGDAADDSLDQSAQPRRTSATRRR